MPIEGPLRELGLPDVFQLLDLSRKTGMLKVKSQLRDDEGHVYFDAGRVVQANLRSKPTPPFDASALTEREVERKLRGQVEGAVYDMMAWREGFFSFEERDLTDIPADTRVKIATESLLMESARRIDEWSRIADKVPHLLVVPVLAAVPDDHESQLDLLPHEWEVLSMIDGRRDLRAIATALGRNEFEAAKVVYGLVTTGVVDIPKAKKVSSTIPPLTVSAVPPPPNPEIRASFAQGKASARAGDFATARASWERFLQLAPDAPEAARVRAAIEALNALRDAVEGLDG
jgi:hypothetical protein